MPRAKTDPEIDLSQITTEDLRKIVRAKKMALDNLQPWYYQEKNKAYIAAAFVCFVLAMILF